MKSTKKPLAIICFILAAPCGFIGWFAYSFWSAGMNPTAAVFLGSASVLIITGLILWIVASANEDQNKRK